MTPLFADTFYFLALANPRDRQHAQARGYNSSERPLLTSGFILLELADFLCDQPNRGLFRRLYEILRSSRDTQIIPVDERVMAAALDLYFAREDKSWSLTDCTSFIIMREHGVNEALTGDRHFEQAGFTALLR